MKLWQPILLVQAATLSLAEDYPEADQVLKDYDKDESEKELKKYIEDFQSIAEKGGQENNNRFMGSESHKSTIQYIKKLLEGWGYEPELQTINTWDCSNKNEGSLWIDGEKQADAHVLKYSPTGTVEGKMAIVGGSGCHEGDFTAESVEGKIALISRGNRRPPPEDCAWGIKTNNARTKGAKGVIFYNNLEGPLKGLTLSNPGGRGDTYIPSIGITREAGEALVAKAKNGESIAKIESKCEERKFSTDNLIAETKSGDDEKVLLIGAHSDSVLQGPGIDDNGSGMAAIIALAKRLHDGDYKVKNKIRFAFWTGEEDGFIGSYYYIKNLKDDDRKKIKLYLNYDTIGSPNGIHFVVTAEGEDSDPAGKYYREFFENEDLHDDKKLPFEELDSGDYVDSWPFYEVGVPIAGIETGLDDPKTEEQAKKFGGKAGELFDPNYHTAGDTADNVNFAILDISSRAGIYAAIKWSDSFDALDG